MILIFHDFIENEIVANRRNINFEIFMFFIATSPVFYLIKVKVKKNNNLQFYLLVYNTVRLNSGIGGLRA